MADLYTTATLMIQMTDLPENTPIALKKQAAIASKHIRDAGRAFDSDISAIGATVERTLGQAKTSKNQNLFTEHTGIQETVKMTDKTLKSFIKQYEDIIAQDKIEKQKLAKGVKSDTLKADTDAAKLVEKLIESADKLNKQAKGYSKMDEDLKTRLKEFLKKVVAENPTVRTEEVTNLIEGKKIDQEKSKP